MDAERIGPRKYTPLRCSSFHCFALRCLQPKSKDVTTIAARNMCVTPVAVAGSVRSISRTIATDIEMDTTQTSVFYWLESSRTWTSETQHRGKLSVALLGAGKILSFFVASYLAKRRPK